MQLESKNKLLNYMMILPNREDFIRENFIELSFQEEETLPNFELFKTLSSAEQYFLAHYFNWDDDITVLNWIIDSPKCDKGTASLIFWRAEPDSYFQYNYETVRSDEKKIVDLLQKIISKFKNNDFKKSSLKFDPIKNNYDVNASSEFEMWNIPSELKKPTKGFSIISTSLIQERMVEYQRMQRLKEREKKKANRLKNKPKK